MSTMQEVPVNVFWDIENCAVPSTMKGVHVVNAIRQFALQRGILKNIAAFANFKLLKERLRADMQESGVLLHDIVTSKANSSDLSILVEILKVVIDNKPPHCIILISGDRDFANVISTLTFRKYKLVLIYSPQASAVLRNAATESVSWNELLKRGGGGVGSSVGKPFCPPEVQIQQFIQPASTFNDKFQPLLNILSSFGGFQVKWTDLGNIVPYDKLGYQKLSYYLFDAEEAGLVKCGTTNNIPWVTIVNVNGFAGIAMQAPPLTSMNKKLPIVPSLSPAYRVSSPMHPTTAPPINTSTSSTNVTTSPSLGNGISIIPSFASAYRTPPPDRNLVINHLLTALESLKKDFFRPTETTLQKRMKELSISLPPLLEWEDIVDIAKTHYFAVEGEKPNRTIYPPAGPFAGADPNHPRDNYPYLWWKAMHQFLIDIHPVAQTGRYGFALYLKEKGPSDVRDMPLGTITEMVQMALDRQLLIYNKKKSIVSTMGNLPDQTQSAISPRAIDAQSQQQPQVQSQAQAQAQTQPQPQAHLLPRLRGVDPYDSDDPHEGEAARSRLVGVTFTWPYRGGINVLVTGNFFNWRNTIALHRREHTSTTTTTTTTSTTSTSQTSNHNSAHNNTNTRLINNSSNSQGNFGATSESEDIFSTVLYLPPGLYEYKFIVDGLWLHDPRQPVVTDKAGNVNNIVDVKPLSATLREYV